MSPLFLPLALFLAVVLAVVLADSSTSSFDSQCTGPIGFVTAFAHPKLVLVNQTVKYRNYRKLCRQNGYEPLMIRDERELGRVLRELKSLRCHHGPAWVDGYWQVKPDPRGKKTPIAVTNSHGGLVEIYPRNAFVRYPALCRSKKIHKGGKKSKSKKSKKAKKCKKAKKSRKHRVCKRTKRLITSKKYPAKCFNGTCTL